MQFIPKASKLLRVILPVLFLTFSLANASPALAFNPSKQITDASIGTTQDRFEPHQIERQNQSVIAGSLVGTLFGHTYTGLGAIDLALGAVIIFLSLKFVLHFGLNYRDYDDEEERQDREETPIQQQARNAWARLYSDPEKANNDFSPPEERDQGGFNRQSFLEGSKILYTRLQESWASRDLKGIEDFLTYEMLDALREQGKLHPEPTKLDILLVTPNFMGLEREEPMETAKVLFVALLQEEKDKEPLEVREYWYFTRNYIADTTWQLSGIEPAAQEN